MDDNGNFIECHAVGNPLFVDEDTQDKFFAELNVNELNIGIGDFVRIQLDEPDASLENFAFGQVLSIFETTATDMFVEVRWMIKIKELSARAKKNRELYSKKRKSFNDTPSEINFSNELIASNVIDDVYAGSIMEIITLKDYISPRTDQARVSDMDQASYFHCELMKYSDSDTLHPLSMDEAFRQGMEMSEYLDAYKEYIQDTTYTYSKDPFSIAIRNLHISIIPDKLPCRDKEHEEIKRFLVGGFRNHGSNVPLYCSGMPGTGKTAVVLTVMKELHKKSLKNELPSFTFVEINCLRISKPEEAYSKLCYALTNEDKKHKSALKFLQQFYSSDVHMILPSMKNDTSKPPLLVCVLDEMDFLLTRNQHVIYNFLNWPRKYQSGLIVIGISNTMNLTERLSLSSTSRLQDDIIQLAFHSYTHQDIHQILANRIHTLQLPGVTEQVINICSRTAASVTGDIRTALKLFQRVLEYIRDESESNAKKNENQHITPLKSSLHHVSDTVKLIALMKKVKSEYLQAPAIRIIQQSCPLDQCVMISICKHIKVSGGVTELKVEDIWYRLQELLQWARNKSIKIIADPPVELFYTCICRLLEMDLIKLIETKGHELTSNDFGQQSGISYSSFAVSIRNGKNMWYQMVSPRQDYGDILGALHSLTESDDDKQENSTNTSNDMTYDISRLVEFAR